MSKLTILSLKSCDTCRKALREIADAGLAADIRDVRADGVSAEMLTGLIDALGNEKLINRRSTTWRGLDDQARAMASDDQTAASVLAEHPTLMKRPVILSGDAVLVGWTDAVRSAVLGSDR